MVTLHKLTITIKTTEKNLEDTKWLLSLCRNLARLSGLRVLKEDFARFEGRGVTAFLILAQSHLSIHTWPEYGLAYVDILSNKDITDEEIASMKDCLIKSEVEIVSFKSTKEPL